VHRLAPVSCDASRTSDRYDRPKRRSHVEALNKEFLTGLFDYWEDRSEKNAQVLLDWLLTIEGTKWHYLHGASDPSKISPDNWVIDQAYQDRPGNKDIQLSISTTREKLDVYDDWQEYFRKHQPPTLITWGKTMESSRWRVLNSLKEIFPAQSSIFSIRAISRWKKEVDRIGSLMHEFLERTITRNKY